MLVDTLVSNVDVSLTLTLSKQAADSLERNFGLQLAMRAAVAVAVIAAYVVSIAQKNTPEQSAVALVRRVIALIVARLIMKNAAMPDSRGATVVLTDTRVARDGSILWTVWPIAEAVMVASILLIVVTFVSRQVDRIGGSLEIERLLKSVQWIFADAIGLLVVDPNVRKYAAVVGIVLLPRLISWSAAAADSTTGAWLQGVAMAWVNIIVAMFIPNNVSTEGTGVDIVAVWVLACTLQALGDTVVPGLGSLQGYVEWHITNVSIAALLATGVGIGDIVTGAAASLLVLQWAAQMETSGSEKRSAVSGFRTMRNVAALVTANAAATWWMASLQSLGAMDNISVIMATVVAAQLAEHLIRKWAEQASIAKEG